MQMSGPLLVSSAFSRLFSFCFCALLYCNVLVLLLYLIVFYTPDACLFSNKSQKGMDLDGRREGGKTIIMVYSMRKKAVFNKKETKAVQCSAMMTRD